MKKIIAALLILITVASFSSCEKDSGKLPNIQFVTGSGYTSANATIAKNASFKIAITASKAEDKDVLKTFDVSQSLDGAAETSIYSESLSGTNADTYTKSIDRTARNVSGTEKYTFTVVNRDGLKNSVTLTLTVQ